MHPYERFRRNEVRSLDLHQVQEALDNDGPSHVLDVAPKDVTVWFTPVPGTQRPGELIATAPQHRSLIFTQHGWASYAARTFTEMEEGKKKVVTSPRSLLRLLQGT